MERDEVVAMLETLAAEVNRGGTKYHRLALKNPANTHRDMDYGWVAATDRSIRLIRDLMDRIGG